MDNRFIIGVIVVFGAGTFFRATNAMTCFNCNGVSDVSQCLGYSSVIKCQQDEVCFMEKKLSSSFQPVYVAGCKAIKFCTINSCQKAVFGDASQSKNTSKRAGEEDLTLCSECCYDNNCNLELCGAKLFDGKNTSQCFDCKDWHTDTVCDRSIDCNLTTHSCLVQRTIRSAHANSFDMGCMRKMQCQILMSLSGEVHDNYTKCCDRHLCNGNPRIPSLDKNLIAMHFDCPTNLVLPTITRTTKLPTTTTVSTTTSTLTPESTTTERLSTSTFHTLPGNSSSLQCRMCDRAILLSDCRSLVSCDSLSQQCYMEQFWNSQLQVRYTGGCRSKTVCDDSSAIFVGRRRRGDQIICSRCCSTGNDCNAELCGINKNQTTSGLLFSGPQNKSLTITAGDRLVLTCDILGPIGTVYNWTKVSSCDGNFQNATESSLTYAKASIGDSGTFACTASTSGQTLSQTILVNVTYLPSLDTCNFDYGTLCSWIQDTSDNFDWTLQSGPTQTENTGPDADHTIGSRAGKYLYIEASAPRSAGEYARLLSHLLSANTQICFEFWSFMYGDGIGNLYVYAQDSCSKTETELYYTAGDKGQNWNHVTVTVPIQSRDFRLVIKADVGPSFRGDTAIDDLLIREGKC